MRLLHRLGLAPGVGDPVVAAVEGGRFPTEQVDDDLAALLEPVTAFARRAELDAVGAGLLLVPPGAEADLEPAARNDVERRGHVGEHGRLAVVDARDQYAEPQPSRRLREGGERRPSLEAGARRVSEDRVEVVERPARLEQVDGIGFAPDGEHVGPGRVLRSGLESEAHAHDPAKPPVPAQTGGMATPVRRIGPDGLADADPTPGMRRQLAFTAPGLWAG